MHQHQDNFNCRPHNRDPSAISTAPAPPKGSHALAVYDIAHARLLEITAKDRDTNEAS
jgi:hypothetical protein